MLWLLLLRHFGMVAVAISWTIRMVLDASLLFIFALSTVRTGRTAVGIKLMQRAGLVIGVAVALAWGVDSLHTGVIVRSSLTLLLEASLVLFIWRQTLDDSEPGNARRATVGLARRARSRL